MELRDRVFAMAGRHLLGETVARIAKLLPEHRQAAVMAALETLRGQDPEAVGGRLFKMRDRQAHRINRLARKRYGVAWDLIDPRIAQTVLLHGRKQNH
jgi:hypothetical protein